MRAVLVLRPEPGNTATCSAARTAGLSPLAAPLFAYRACDWQIRADGQWRGLLIGSAAVFALGGAGLDSLRSVPVHAVGAATARAATAAGFDVAGAGRGGLQSLVDRLAPGRYLRLAGRARVPLHPPVGVFIDDVVVYAALPLPLSSDAIALIRRDAAVVLLHSATAARHFAGECAAHGLPRDRIALACLAPRIAAQAGAGWQSVAIAPRLDDDAVLSLAWQMCQ